MNIEQYIEQVLNEHKKGVKAIKYNKKPQPHIGPDAIKRKEVQKKKVAIKKVEPSAVKSVTESSVQKIDDYDRWRDRVNARGGEVHPQKDRVRLVAQSWDGDTIGEFNLKTNQGWINKQHVDEGLDYSKRKRLIHYLAKKLDIEINYLELSSDSELIDLYKQAKAKEQDMTESSDDIDSAKERLAHLENIFDPSYEYSDDHSEWKKHNEIRQEMNRLKKIIRQSEHGVDESSVQDKLYKKHQELRKKAGLPDPEHYKKLGQQKQKEIDDMKKSSIKEVEMGKIVDYKPGQTATLNTGPGMTTILDLKKNPTSLTKDPTTGKLKLMGPQAQGTPGATSTQASTIKPGDSVEIEKTMEDILKLSGLK
jgi:hypothetical protein